MPRGRKWSRGQDALLNVPQSSLQVSVHYKVKMNTVNGQIHVIHRSDCRCSTKNPIKDLGAGLTQNR